MKHLFIPYELALIAKEKGFDETCICYFDRGWEDVLFTATSLSGRMDSQCGHENNVNDNSISAPLYQQIVDWFRDKGSIFIDIHIDGTNNYSFELNSTFKMSKGIRDGQYPTVLAQRFEYKTYYEALNKAIEEAFKLI